MNRAWLAALPMSMAAALMVFGLALAQDTVGGLRVVDEAGETIGQEAAPPGEKLYRLAADVTRFRIAMDFEGGSVTDVQVRVMGPSGTILHQSAQTYDAPGTYTVEIDNGETPFSEQEYVVNAYVGPDAYLADSLQLVVGDVQLPAPGDAVPAESLAMQAQPVLVSESDTAGQVPLPAADVPGGPPTAVLALAVAGIVMLFGIVLWAGWSATRRA